MLQRLLQVRWSHYTPCNCNFRINLYNSAQEVNIIPILTTIREASTLELCLCWTWHIVAIFYSSFSIIVHTVSMLVWSRAHCLLSICGPLSRPGARSPQPLCAFTPNLLSPPLGGFFDDTLKVNQHGDLNIDLECVSISENDHTTVNHAMMTFLSKSNGIRHYGFTTTPLHLGTTLLVMTSTPSPTKKSSLLLLLTREWW